MVNIFWPFDFTDKSSLCWHGWIVEIFNVLVKNKIRTSLPNIVRIAMHIDIYGRSLSLRGFFVTRDHVLLVYTR